MGLRLYRRVRILPGLSVNLSRSGPSLSVGVRGAHVTLGHRGIRRTVGLPGTGVFYTSTQGWHSGAGSHPIAPTVRQASAAPTTSQGHGRALVAAFLLGAAALIVWRLLV